MRGVLAAVVLALLALAAAPPGVARPGQVQHVTLIGDSVADAVRLNDTSVSILRQGVDLDLEVAPCRRVEGVGCPYKGAVPPSVVQLTASMGARLGANVVVAVGYNDFADQWAGNVDDALTAFEQAGVKHVWWLTLRAAHHPYVGMNTQLAAAAQKHPELKLIDWNVYSRSHPEWFQSDGVHLLNAGAVAMATLVHRTLLAAGVASAPPRVVTKTLPAAHRGRAYRARLAATAGSQPYRWSLLERAPPGIHLAPNGAISGIPAARVGRYTFDVKVTDATGSFSTRRLTLRIT